MSQRILFLFFVIILAFGYSRAQESEFDNENGEGKEGHSAKLAEFLDPFYGMRRLRPKRDQRGSDQDPRGRLKVQLKFDERTRQVQIKDARVQSRARRHETGAPHTHSEHQAHAGHRQHHESHSSEEQAHARTPREAHAYSDSTHQGTVMHQDSHSSEEGARRQTREADEEDLSEESNEAAFSDQASVEIETEERAKREVLIALNETSDSSEEAGRNKTKASKLKKVKLGKKNETSSSSSESSEHEGRNKTKTVKLKKVKLAKGNNESSSSSESSEEKKRKPREASPSRASSRRSQNRQREESTAHEHAAKKKEKEKESSEEKTSTAATPTTTTTPKRQKRSGVIQASFGRDDQYQNTEGAFREQQQRARVGKTIKQ